MNMQKINTNKKPNQTQHQPQLVMIENYDSFSYNIVQYFAELNRTITVVQNDEVDMVSLQSHNSGLILSPGPCTPNEAGQTLAVIDACHTSHPVLGVCLGHQAIGQYFGGQVVRAHLPVHGKQTNIYHDSTGVFANLPNPFVAVRYNSLVVDRASVPSCLSVNAWTQTEAGAVDEVMGLRHHTLPIHSVQFHPESVAATNGHALFQNWLDVALLI